jgi:uncharacterized membrane protein
MQVSQAEANAFCSAFAVLQQKCVRCHSDPPVNGAPFSLDSYEATQVPSHSGDELRTDRIKRAVESGFMPLTSLRVDPPVEPLTCEERATLLAWIDAGAPPPPDGDPRCESTLPSLAACDEP